MLHTPTLPRPRHTWAPGSRRPTNPEWAPTVGPLSVLALTLTMWLSIKPRHTLGELLFVNENIIIEICKRVLKNWIDDLIMCKMIKRNLY